MNTENEIVDSLLQQLLHGLADLSLTGAKPHIILKIFKILLAFKKIKFAFKED